MTRGKDKDLKVKDTNPPALLPMTQGGLIGSLGP